VDTKWICISVIDNLERSWRERAATIPLALAEKDFVVNIHGKALAQFVINHSEAKKLDRNSVSGIISLVLGL